MNNLLLSVTEANDKPADPLYVDTIIGKSKEMGGAAVDELSHWLSCRCAVDKVPVKIKTFTLMTRVINEVTP